MYIGRNASSAIQIAFCILGFNNLERFNNLKSINNIVRFNNLRRFNNLWRFTIFKGSTILYETPPDYILLSIFINSYPFSSMLSNFIHFTAWYAMHQCIAMRQNLPVAEYLTPIESRWPQPKAPKIQNLFKVYLRGCQSCGGWWGVGLPSFAATNHCWFNRFVHFCTNPAFHTFSSAETFSVE